MAFTFVRTKHVYAAKSKREEGTKEVRAWMKSKPNVIFCDFCRGLGMDGIMISFHRSYEGFDEFITEHNHELGSLIDDVKNVLVNLGKMKNSIKPFNLKYLTKDRNTE